MNNKNEMTIKETERIYHFPKGERVVLKEVRKIVIEPSGTHKIKTAETFYTTYYNWEKTYN